MPRDELLVVDQRWVFAQLLGGFRMAVEKLVKAATSERVMSLRSAGAVCAFAGMPSQSRVINAIMNSGYVEQCLMFFIIGCLTSCVDQDRS